MVRTGEIHHLEVEVLLSEVSGIPECNGEPDASERSGLGSGDDFEERCPTRVEVLPQDPHAVEHVGVENVEIAPTVYQHLHKVDLSDDGVNDKWEMA